MSTDGRSIEEISDAFSPIASGVIKAAAGGMSQGIKDSSLDVWGALVGDPLKMWRTRRLVDGLERVAAHIKNKGLNLTDAKSLPYGDMLILFDGISKEDDPDLSDMWARLISESMTPNDEPTISARSVAALLEQMSPESAKVFRLLAKEARNSFLLDKLSRIRNKDFFPLTEEESKLCEEDLRCEHEKLKIEIESEWSDISKSVSSVEAKFEIAKGELLRLNLIEMKEVTVEFDSAPFSRGYSFNAAGLERVLSELHGNVKDLVNSRTNPAKQPFLDRRHGGVRSSFVLSMAGREIAKKLCLL